MVINKFVIFILQIGGNNNERSSSMIKVIEEAAPVMSPNLKCPTNIGLSESSGAGNIPFCIAPLQLKNGIGRQGGNQFDTRGKQLSVASSEVNNFCSATFKGFSGNGITAVEQSAKNICPKRRFLPHTSRECISPGEIHPSNLSQSLNKEKTVNNGK